MSEPEGSVFTRFVGDTELPLNSIRRKCILGRVVFLIMQKEPLYAEVTQWDQFDWEFLFSFAVYRE